MFLSSDRSAETATVPAAEPPSTNGQPSPPRRELPVDASRIATAYANFARVTTAPEELALDFGLNMNAARAAGEPVQLTQRVVMNFFTAKRLFTALGLALQQHERIFGAIETDLHKRIAANRAAPPQPAASPAT